jgi:hypothetical protein
MASLIGGLQSAMNPGGNMTPGYRRVRSSRMNRPLGPHTASAWHHPWHPGPTSTPQGPYNHGPFGYHPPAATTASGPPAPTGPYTPPGGHAGALPSPATILTFDQWLASNPQWIAQSGLDANSRNQQMASYGFYRDAAGHLVGDPKAAQDSLYASLGQQHSQAEGHVAQAGANHGNLFSGATLLGVQNASDAYKRGVGKAMADLTGNLGKIDQGELDLKQTLSPDYQDFVANTPSPVKPEDFLKTVQGMGTDLQGNANAVSTIDAYLKKYGSTLTPAQRSALQHERDVQVNAYQHRKHHADIMRTHTTPPPKPRRPRKPRHPHHHHERPGAGMTGGIAGGGA